MAVMMVVTASVALAVSETACGLSSDRIDRLEDRIDDRAGIFKPTGGLAQARENMLLKNQQNLCP